MAVGMMDQYLDKQATAMKLRGYRQDVLASNIANSDTPNYKARDFDFQSAYQAAVANNGKSTASLATTDARHLQPRNQVDLFAPTLQYRTETQPSIDGNTVDMNVEMRDFADNTLRSEASITFMQNAISSYRAALSSQ